MSETASAGQATASGSVAAYEFPSSVASSFSYWLKNFTRSSAVRAEEAIVKRGLGDAIPLVATAEEAHQAQGCRAVFHNVPLQGSAKDSKRYMRVLEIGPATRSPDEHAVFLTHGYGNGLGFYFQQFKALAAVPNVRYFYLDWLGMGCSGRPSFPNIKHGDKTEAAAKKRVTEAEAWFTTSLDECRQKLGVAKINTLCGHSIGGYLSASYALKYPDSVGKLVLISPVGVPEAPWNTFAFDEDDDDVEARVAQQFEQNQQAATALEEQMLPASDPKVEAGTTEEKQNTPSASGSGRATPESSEGAPGGHFRRKDPPSGWWTKLWEANISPFSILRGATFMGPSLISRYASRRFAAFPDDTKKELFGYLYQISTDRGSGEYVLAHVLAPGAFARWPLKKRLGRLDLPITFFYGDNDWMDSSCGQEALDEVILAKPSRPETERQRARSKLLINEHSGHWVHLENPDGFNAMFMKELKESIEDQNSA